MRFEILENNMRMDNEIELKGSIKTRIEEKKEKLTLSLLASLAIKIP